MRKPTQLLALAFTASLIGLSGSSLQTSSAQTMSAQTSMASSAYYLPKGFKLTPFVTKMPVRSFKEAKYVMKDNTDYQAVIESDAGRMVIDLFEDDTPTTVNSVLPTVTSLIRLMKRLVSERLIPAVGSSSKITLAPPAMVMPISSARCSA